MRSSEDDIVEDPFNERPSLIWRFITGIFKLLMVLLLLVVLALCFVYYTSQKSPEFYTAALREEGTKSKELGSQLETDVLDIYNSAVSPTEWQGELSEAGINGWLASELTEKFPELLPDNVRDPRVSLKENELAIACRCNYKDLHGILVGSFDLFCTDQPNQIAIRIRSIKIGIVPFPVTQFADQVTEYLQSSGYESSWTELEGDPVLLIDVPEDHLVIEEDYRVDIKSIDIEDKKILFTGETVELQTVGDANDERAKQNGSVVE